MSDNELEDAPVFTEQALDSSTSMNSSTSSQPVTTKRKNWIYVETYDTRDLALQAVYAYDTYSYKRSHETSAGKKEEYRCSKCKVRGPQCASAVQLLYHEDDLTVSLYKTRSDHTHDTILQVHSRNGIPLHTRQIIDEYLRLKITVPSVIIMNLEEAKLNDPSIVIPTLAQVKILIYLH